MLGLFLGIVWLSCAGSVPDSGLTISTVSGKITYEALMLFIYSLGFSIPMFLIAYSASFSSSKLQKVSKDGFPLKKDSGFIIPRVEFLWLPESFRGSRRKIALLASQQTTGRFTQLKLFNIT